MRAPCPSPRGFLRTLALAAALALLCLSAAWADGGAPATEAAPAEVTAAEAVTPAASGPSRVDNVHGVTISWDLEGQRFRTTSAEEAAALAAELRRVVAERFAGDAAGKAGVLAPERRFETETLPGGGVKARINAGMLSTLLVRVGAEGELVKACVDGPEPAGEVLSQPAADLTAEEVR